MSGVRLDHKLVLEAPVDLPDGAGGLARSWAVLGTLWGEITPRTGRETRGETGPMTTTGFRITVRAAPVGQSNRPDAGQRFRCGARIFAIHAVTERARAPQYLVCMAEEESVT